MNLHAICPHCGAAKLYPHVSEIIEPTSPLYSAIPFRCGSKNGYRSDLCREREAHNQTTDEPKERYKHENIRTHQDAPTLLG